MRTLAIVTVELRNLLKTDFELFDFEYQFDDPIFKAQLEQAVIDYYYYYEIGSETPDAFKLRFKARWLRMIDYYNKLYNTTLLNYDPLINSRMTEALEQLSNTTTNQDTSTNTDDESTSTSDGNTKNSDYPQQPIAGGDFLEGESESTSTTNTTSEGTTTGTSQTVGQADTSYSKTVEGLTGTSYQELIGKERSNLLRITQMVIEEMKHSFILVN